MENVWWEQVTHANAFIHEIVSEVLNDKSVILVLPEHTPWDYCLRDNVENALSRENSSKSMKVIDSPHEKVGEFMLNRYCCEEQRLQYRVCKTHAEFLAGCEDTVLNSYYIWVRNIPENLFPEWINFLSDYHKNISPERESAVFILETCDPKIRMKFVKGVSNVSYGAMVNTFDAYTFCILASSDAADEIYKKNYLAELVYSICGEDIELCAECIRQGTAFSEDPAGILARILETTCRSDGSSFVLDLDKLNLDKRIWKTQMKMLFPMIEDYRGEFVERYRKQIDCQLPFRNSSNDIVFSEPEEVEIGTLSFMAASKLINIDTKEHTRLHQFKEARNTLAHLKTLSLEEVYHILSGN